MCDPQTRYNLDQIKAHTWFRGEVCSYEDLKEELKWRILEVEEVRQMEERFKKASKELLHDSSRSSSGEQISTTTTDEGEKVAKFREELVPQFILINNRLRELFGHRSEEMHLSREELLEELEKEEQVKREEELKSSEEEEEPS